MSKKIYDICFEVFVVIMFLCYVFCIPETKSIEVVNTNDTISVIDFNKEFEVIENSIEFATYPYFISEEGKEFIKSHEDLRLEAYNDPSPTKRSIGWGHQIQPGENYETITKKQADEIFEQDIKKIEASVNRLLKKTNPNFKYTQGFIDGLGSLVYNCGEYGVSTTDFYKRLLKCRVDDSEDNIREDDLNFTLAAVKTSKIFYEGHKIRRINEYNMMIN